MRQYEWEGEPAFAIISQKHDADLGVVPSIHVNKVLKLTEDYRVTGKIIGLNEIMYRGEPYTTCDIELSCYEKKSYQQAKGGFSYAITKGIYI